MLEIKEIQIKRQMMTKPSFDRLGIIVFFLSHQINRDDDREKGFFEA